jgi:hypothetical protein
MKTKLLLSLVFLLLIFSFSCVLQTHEEDSILHMDIEKNSDLENGDVTIQFTIDNQWGTGYVAAISVTNNTSQNISGWEVSWTAQSNDQLVNGWNATITQSGSTFNASHLSWNQTIYPNQAISFGFQASFQGTLSLPAEVTFNGVIFNIGDDQTPTPTATVPDPTPTPTPAITSPPSSDITELTKIVNGRFRLGDMYWTTYVNTPAQANFTVADEVLIINPVQAGTEDWHIQLSQAGIPIMENRTYRVSLDARSDSIQSITLIISQSSDTYQSYSNTVVIDLTQNWTYYEWDLIVGGFSEEDLNARIEINMGNATAPIQLDNIKMLLLDEPIPAKWSNVTKIQSITPCTPAGDADPDVIAHIESMGAQIWQGGATSVHDQEITSFAHDYFATEAVFIQFLINWTNVETGGHFNANHENWSQDGTERNVGILQINQTWAIRHDTWNWHDSNPHEYIADDAFNPSLCVDWALHHIIGVGPHADWNLTKMLDSYWHGTFNDPSDYAAGVYDGHIIDYPE